MLIVACAIAIGLIVEAGVVPAVTIVVGTTAFLAVAAGHVLLRRNERLARLEAALRVEREDVFRDKSDGDGPRLDLPNSRDVTGATEHKDGLARLRVGSPGEHSLEPAAPRKTEAADVGGVLQRIASDIEAGQKELDGKLAEDNGPPPIMPEDFGFLPETSQVAAAGDDGAARVTASDKLAAVMDALANERVEVYLEPIHGLADGKPRHYEVSVRLSLADGGELSAPGYREATQGSALLPLIDAVKVSKARNVGLYLLRRGHSGSVISEVSGESVSAAEFGDDLATIMGQDGIMAERLVLSFGQYDVRGFTPTQWASIDRLARLGFRFAVADITDLDMDFEALSQRGFVFAKLDAGVFVEGLPAGVTTIPPTDVCRHLAGSGLTLVVDHLDDDRLVAEVVGFGALFGQGELFGSPRPVKAEALKAQGNRF